MRARKRENAKMLNEFSICPYMRTDARPAEHFPTHIASPRLAYTHHVGGENCDVFGECCLFWNKMFSFTDRWIELIALGWKNGAPDQPSSSFQHSASSDPKGNAIKMLPTTDNSASVCLSALCLHAVRSVCDYDVSDVVDVAARLPGSCCFFTFVVITMTTN